jgi:hypothetical protein
MNWDAIGAVAELIGALAVIATLAYLAIQTRQNTDAVKVQTISTLSDRLATSNTGPQSEYLSGVLERGRQSYKNLAPSEQLSFAYWMLERVMVYESLLGSPEAVNPSVLEACDRNLRYLFDSEGARDWWEADSREDITSTMREYINNLVPDA